MKKWLSLMLAAALFLSIVPAFAETGGLSDLLGGLLDGSSEGENGSALSDLLGGILGGASDGENGSGLSGVLGGLLGKLSGGESGSGLSELSGLLDGLMSKLGGDSGKLSGLIAAVKDIVKNLLGSTNSKGDFSALLNGLMSRFSGSGSAEKTAGFNVGDLLGSLLGGVTGESSKEMSDEEWDQMIEDYHNSPEYQEELARNAALEAYVLNEYQDTLEAGDARFVCIGAGVDDAVEDGTFKYLRNFSLTNFTADGTGLRMKNYANNVEMLILGKNSEGAYEVTEATQAEEGEKQAASIEAMSEKFGEKLETVTINLGRKESAEAFALATFLRNHPEYEKAEFMGELRTAEELDDLASDLLTEELKDVEVDLSDLSF